MQNLLRASAEALAHLADKVHSWADWVDDRAAAIDPDGPAREFAGLDFVGIDFSTSIRRAAAHVIRGWDIFRSRVSSLRPDHGVWAFGVNALAFPLTGAPVSPRRLQRLDADHFQRRGVGRGLVECGSAFYDFFHAALRRGRELGAFDRAGGVPVTVALLCDGWPNGGAYGPREVRPEVEAARAQGVRFKVVGFAAREDRAMMQWFGESLGLRPEELEVTWYDGGGPDGEAVSHGFTSLSCF